MVRMLIFIRENIIRSALLISTNIVSSARECNSQEPKKASALASQKAHADAFTTQNKLRYRLNRRCSIHLNSPPLGAFHFRQSQIQHAIFKF